MFTVIRVYGWDIDDFVIIVKDGELVKNCGNGISEFTVCDIMKVAGADVVIGSSMTASQFAKRAYKIYKK